MGQRQRAPAPTPSAPGCCTPAAAACIQASPPHLQSHGNRLCRRLPSDTHNVNFALGVEVPDRQIPFVLEGWLLCQARLILRLPAENASQAAASPKGKAHGPHNLTEKHAGHIVCPKQAVAAHH